MILWTILFLMARVCWEMGNLVKEKPNILIVVTDDQGWGDLSFHGNSILETPNLDSLASSAVRFEKFYVSPVCAPTRASLLTGRYHLATGTSWVTHRTEVMRENEVTIAEIFKSNGYRTGLFGKWHQGKQFPHDPIGQGFEEFSGFTEGHANTYFDAILMHNFVPEKTQGYMADVLTEKAIRFMEKPDPFFTVLSLNTPHSPFQVPDVYFEKYSKKGLDDREACIYGMVENIDFNVGRIMDFLETSGKLQNTIIIFMTDNGPNGIRFNGGMKGKKGDLDEGGMRVPFFIKIPGIPNQTINQWAAHIDILPTVCELTNTLVPKELDIHGRSLVPLIRGGAQWEDRLFFNHQVIRKFDTLPGAVRTQDHLLVIKPDQKYLYNLTRDPSQHTNLIQELPGKAAELEAEYAAWIREMTKQGLQPPRIQIGHEKVPLIELPAPDAKLRGNVRFFGKDGWANDWLVGFDAKEDEASWELESVENVSYEMILALSSQGPCRLEVNLGGRTITVDIPEKILAQASANFDRIPRSEVPEMIWPNISLGVQTFPKGLQSISIRPVEGSFTGIQLKSIYLIDPASNLKLIQ